MFDPSSLFATDVLRPAYPGFLDWAPVPESKARRPASVAQPPAPCPSPATEADSLRSIALIQSRDESGLRQLHARFHRRVFSCALSIVRREEVANEVVSTCFMQAWTSAASYDPARATVLSWLLLIARSRALDALRRSRLIQAREVSVDDDEAQEEIAGDRLLEPGVQLDRQHRQRRLQRELLRLSPIQRQVLSLTTLAGLSQDEASCHLNLPLGTVKSHARRAMAALKARCETIGLTTE